MSNRGLRIIAGRFKRRRLRVPDVADVRPTPERVREALFSILGARTESARVLDAFAGSGALGFEAASRGAAQVTFVECNPKVAAAIRSSVSNLGIQDACEVIEARLPGGARLHDLRGPYDIVLADPPYALKGSDGLKTLEALGALLDPDGLLLWERDSRGESASVSGLNLLESRRYGNTTIDLYEPGKIGQDGPSR